MKISKTLTIMVTFTALFCVNTALAAYYTVQPKETKTFDDIVEELDVPEQDLVYINQVLFTEIADLNQLKPGDKIRYVSNTDIEFAKDELARIKNSNTHSGAERYWNSLWLEHLWGNRITYDDSPNGIPVYVIFKKVLEHGEFLTAKAEANKAAEAELKKYLASLDELSKRLAEQSAKKDTIAIVPGSVFYSTHSL